MSGPSDQNEEVSAVDISGRHSGLAVQAARAATLLLAIAFLMPRVNWLPYLIEHHQHGGAVEPLGPFLSRILLNVSIPLALSGIVGTLVSLLQAKLRDRWWSGAGIGYHQERPGGIGAMLLVVVGGAALGIWGLWWWASSVSGCLGIKGDIRDLLVHLRGWLISLGGGLACISVGALVFVHRLWDRRGHQ